MQDALGIGLIGKRGDPQIGRLQEEVSRRGGRPVPFDLTDIPAHVNFHWEGESLAFGEIELDALRAVYARTAHFPMPTFIPGQGTEVSEALTFPVREIGSLLNAIVAAVAERMPIINPLGSHRFHRQKPLMYRTLQRAGVPVPEFAVGCDLARAAHFIDRHDEAVVVKPLMGGEVYQADLAYLKAHHQEFEKRPFLLQRRIMGRSLRAYAVKGRVVAAAEMVHGEVVDWRNDLSAVNAVTLGAEAESAVLKAAAAQGLIFSAADLEEEGGPGGIPWVIDVNPGPMFAAFEGRSGLDVAGPLADTLLEFAKEQPELQNGTAPAQKQHEPAAPAKEERP